jgi:hypothetical protein
MTQDLKQIYARARGYKDSVLRQWIDNLSRHAMNGAAEVKAEALRRIAFIEQNLLSKKSEADPTPEES